MPNILEAANEEALKQVRAEKPQSFTVGGHYDGKKIVGGLTYQRSWTNGWGATAYARAWWEDATVSTHAKRPKVEAGAELTKRF